MINKDNTYKHLFLSFILFALNVAFARHAPNAGEKNPFTPKAFVIRYWDKHITNTLPKPTFLLSKASPLSAVDAAKFEKLITSNTLSTPEFCSAAQLLCSGREIIHPTLATKHTKDVKFSAYNDGENFTNYGASRTEGVDSFKKYSDDALISNSPVNSFQRYSHASSTHYDDFDSYGNKQNVVEQRFNSYGKETVTASSEFNKYQGETNVADVGFASYSEGTNSRKSFFTRYGEDGNSGKQSFRSYGKEGFFSQNEFKSYGRDSNTAVSDFTSYTEVGAGSTNDTFRNYGANENNPTLNFKSYEDGSIYAHESFANYRNNSNVGDSSFQSYAKNSRDGAIVNFNNYGKSVNVGSDTFKGYAKGAALSHKVGFKEYYGLNTTFKDYAKDGITFSAYANLNGSLVKKWVEKGKFFRERMLNEGTIIPMPDIRDKSPKRSFLPRSILSKIPFSSSKIIELKQIFKVSNNSSMEKMMMDTFGDCEREPSIGETKRCVGSIEDMIDFATSILDHNVVVRTTENVNGSKTNVMVGKVKRVNGGKVTKSVSCHQSLFPYLVYYCHSVPKVRLYEADLLDPKSKAKINHGVAICHLDTTAWSPTHGAFLALGSGPGHIEVCHWIFENDLTWTFAD